MKVLLIYPNINDYPIDISFGLASIAAALEQNGHQVRLLDLTFNKSKNRIKSIINKYSPQIIGLPIASNDFNYVVEISSYIKRIKDIPIICGGYHATLAPDDVIRNECFDIAVRGEGEDTFLEIINAIENNYSFNSIKGICYKDKGEIIKNSLRPLRQDISKLPFPDKGVFNYLKYLKYNRGLATFISSFGCPFLCSYCINKSIMNLFNKDKESYVRFKPIDYLIKEIKEVLSQYKVREIEFYDETFTIDKSRVKNFCEIYKKEIGLPFYINARVDTINEEILSFLKDAGCVRISMGIETGDSYVRNEVLKRKQTDQQIINAFKLVKKYKMQTLSYNMVGIPFETKESIKKTIELNRICKPDFIAVSIFNAYQGTELYDICKRNGWLREERGLSYFKTSNVNHPNFTLKELKKIRDHFGYYVFKSDNYKRAIIDLIDKKLLKYRLYLKIRSFLIRRGIKKML